MNSCRSYFAEDIYFIGEETCSRNEYHMNYGTIFDRNEIIS